jgi:hypothetical protein
MNFSFEERNEEIKGKESFEEISFPILVRDNVQDIVY